MARSEGITIQIGNVSLAAKLDALAATLAAIRDAHRDTMNTRCWSEINRAQDRLAEATMHSREPEPDPARRFLNQPEKKGIGADSFQIGPGRADLF